MDEQIIASWERARSSLFTDVSGMRVTLLPGERHLLKAIHLGRTSVKRKTDIKTDKLEKVTDRPFDEMKFNFLKVAPNEVLVDMAPHRVLVNASPLTFGHFLFCPFIEQKMNQKLTSQAIATVLTFAKGFKRKDFHMMFNSLGGWASVNHLHFHGLFLGGNEWKEDEHRLPCEVERIMDKDCLLFPNGSFPVEKCREVGECFYTASGSSVTLIDSHVLGIRLRSGSEDGFAGDVWSLIRAILDLDIPHNLLIADSAETVFVFPRQIQQVNLLPYSLSNQGLNVAASETGGYIVCMDEPTYANLTEEDVCVICRRDVSLPKETLAALVNNAFI